MKKNYPKNRAKTRDYSKTNFNPYKGSEHPSWKRGFHIDGKGYIVKTVAPSIYQKEHRFVMEQHLGRKLKRSEFVHHKNENRADNRLSNLEIICCPKHTSLHRRLYEARRKD